MAKPTVATLALRLDSLESNLSKLVDHMLGEQVALQPEETQPTVEVKQGKMDDETFKKVYKASMKKAVAWGQKNGCTVQVSHVYSVNKQRPYVMFGRKIKQGGVHMATISPTGEIARHIKGLPTL